MNRLNRTFPIEPELMVSSRPELRDSTDGKSGTWRYLDSLGAERPAP
jgi:hypothetical protein